MGLGDAELQRYARQLALPEWGEPAQLALREASVGVIGAGALGGPVALYLAAAGVGRLGIVDPDSVELSNLHRQVLHFTPDVGTPKVASAVAKLGFLNPEIVIEPYQAEVAPRNAPILLADFDLVVDCTDSHAARCEINAACCSLRRPLIEGGALGLRGLVMPIEPGETACYRCAFPRPPADCAPGGVLGPVPGTVGALMALEALKRLAGLPSPLRGAFLELDLGASTFTRVATQRRPGCPDCGEAEPGSVDNRG